MLINGTKLLKSVGKNNKNGYGAGVYIRLMYYLKFSNLGVLFFQSSGEKADKRVFPKRG